MASWPITLPRPLVSGYGLNPVDQTIRTDMETGSARVRRRSAARLDMLDVGWKLTDAQMDIFRAWFEDGATGAAGGAAWFAVDLALGDGGILNEEARFNGAWKASLLPGMNWQVSARLEVR